MFFFFSFHSQGISFVVCKITTYDKNVITVRLDTFLNVFLFFFFIHNERKKYSPFMYLSVSCNLQLQLITPEIKQAVVLSFCGLSFP